MRTRLLVASALVVATVVVFACGGKKPPPKEPTITETVTDAGDAEAEAPTPKSLFERLGGQEAITKVVDTLLKNIQADAKINKRFAKTTGARLEKFKQNLVEQICEASGGPCHYQGKEMKATHKGMKIKEDEWNAFILDLKAALDEAKIGETEQSDLIAVLAPMKDDVVEVKPKPKK